MTSRYLFLDVDGVLNPIVDPSGDGWEPVPEAPFPLILNRSIGDRIAASGLEVWWLSTWGDRANDWVAPFFGWDPCPVVPNVAPPPLKFGERGQVNSSLSPHWWKGRALQAAFAAGTLNPNRGFVWADDSLHRGEWRQWATANGGRCVQPRGRDGLSDGQLAHLAD